MKMTLIARTEAGELNYEFIDYECDQRKLDKVVDAFIEKEERYEKASKPGSVPDLPVSDVGLRPVVYRRPHFKFTCPKCGYWYFQLTGVEDNERHLKLQCLQCGRVETFTHQA